MSLSLIPGIFSKPGAKWPQTLDLVAALKRGFATLEREDGSVLLEMAAQNFYVQISRVNPGAHRESGCGACRLAGSDTGRNFLGRMMDSMVYCNTSSGHQQVREFARQ